MRPERVPAAPRLCQLHHPRAGRLRAAAGLALAEDDLQDGAVHGDVGRRGGAGHLRRELGISQ